MKLRPILCAALLLGTLAATTVEPMSVERLARESSLIVRGRAGTSWVEWDEAGTLMYTHTRIAVAQAWRGTPIESIVVKQPGGSDGRYTQRVSGVRYFHTGDESILFLKPSASGESYIVTGLMQGNFRVHRSADGKEMASNGVRGVHALDRASGAVREYRGARMTVPELESRVRRALE